jgi:vesicle-fusing ATPase
LSRMTSHVPLGESSPLSINTSSILTTYQRHDNTGKLLPGTIGASALQRQWIGLSAVGDETTVDPLPTPPHPSAPPYLESIDIEVGFLRRGAQATEAFSADEMSRNFLKAFSGIVFAPGQLLVFEFHGQNLKALVKGVGILELADEQRRGGQQGRRQDNMGILMDKTDVGFLKAGDSPIKIKSSSKK